MEKNMSVDQVVERARRVQDKRIEAIRDLAEARQNLTDVKQESARQVAELERVTGEQIAAAEREDVRRHAAALSAGWSVEEMRRIGFAEPDKKVRARRRSARTAAAAPVLNEHAEQDAPAETTVVSSPSESTHQVH